ncbi:MAG: class I adenylate-forming enzyme family protein [Promethearchaeota archaeon]
MDIPKLNYFWEYVDYWAEKEPDFVSIRFKKKTISARELKEKTDQFAKLLLSLGVKKGDTVATVLSTIPEFVISYIGAAKIGAITIPMDKAYKKTDFITLIPHSAPKVIVTIDKWEKNKIADNLLELKTQFGDVHYIVIGNHELGPSFDSLMEKEYSYDSQLEEAKNNQDKNDCILVIWTGGTTGAPKAVELTHKNIIEMCYLEYKKIKEDLSKIEGFVEQPHEPFLVNLPTSHVGGTVELIGSSIVGGNEMIMQASWSPFDSLKAMQDFNISFMGGVPTMFKIFLSLPNLASYEPKKYLKIAFMSGEKVSMELLNGIKEQMCENIVIGYGSTEAGSEVTFTEIGDPFEDLANGYVGKPLPGMVIKVIDEKGKELPAGVDGEIIVKGPLTAKRYFKMPKEDKEGFTEDGFCKTGDLGHLDDKGGLWITGRIKQIIRVGAYTVFPNEIEELVVQHPKVALAAALGAPDEIKGEVVWLVIGPELGQKFTKEDEEEIMELCRNNLAKFKVPQKIIVYPLDPNDLPITRIGKVDRVRLAKELLPKAK